MNPVLDSILEKNNDTPPAAAPAAAAAPAKKGDDNNTDDDTPPAGDPPPAAAAAAAAAPNAEEFDPEKVLAFLKKNGFKGEKLEEIYQPAAAPEPLTEEQKLKAAEEKRSKVLIYGLESGKIKSEAEYRKYLGELQKPARDIAFELFKAERLQEDSTLTDQTLQDEFKDENFEHLAEDDPKRKRAAKMLEATKEAYITQNYGHIENLEEDYDEHDNEIQSQQSYIARVDSIFSALPKSIPFEVKDPNDPKKVLSYNFNIPDESLKTLQEVYKGKEYSTLFRKGSMKDEDFQAAVLTSLKAKELGRIIGEIADAHATAMLDDFSKGRRGIKPHREEGGSEGKLVVGNGISDQIIENNKN